MTPLVSILIPCYNAEPFVAAALDSALAQDYPAIEVVCVDDGSRDGTLGILRRYEADDERVRVIAQENRGQSAAFNRAFEACRGEYISFFDADDLLAPNKISVQMREAFRGGAVRDAMATCAWGRFYEDPREAEAQREYPLFRTMAPVDWLVEAWAGHLMMHGATWLIPREVLAKSGLWDERTSLINDHEFFCRVMLACRGIVFVPGTRTFYRSAVEGNLSGQRSRKALESAFFALAESSRRLLAAEDSPRTRRACADKLQRFVYEYHPAAPDLLAQAEALVREYGGSSVEPHVGGRGFKALSRVVGWKAAKRAKDAFYRMGYGKAGLRRKARARG